MNILSWIDQRRHWWKVFVLIFTVSVVVVGYIGVKTYQYAPPVCDFIDEQGKVVFSGADINAGQQIFLRYGLMEYGSFLGDGGMRGPDFTGEALNLTARWMNEFYDGQWKAKIPEDHTRAIVVKSLVQEELKQNRFSADYQPKEAGRFDPGAVTMSPAQVASFQKLNQYYVQKLSIAEGKERAVYRSFLDFLVLLC